MNPSQVPNPANPYDFAGVQVPCLVNSSQQQPPPSSYKRNQIGTRAGPGTAMRPVGTAQ